MTGLRTVGTLVGITLLSGCVGHDVDLLNQTEATGGTPFTRQLAVEYREMANYEGHRMDDWASAELYARRGLAAANGDVLEPFHLADFYLPENSVADLQDGRYRLVQALVTGAREQFPEDAATAQVYYDCWVEQTEENEQAEHIAACRDGFFAALALIETQPSGTPVYYVFFDFDRDEITPEAQGVLAQVISDYGAGGGSVIEVTGHTDLSGSDSYNEDLSRRRAEAVRSALELGGVPGGVILASFEGERNPLVPTPDGVREPSNRRAELRLR